MDEEERRDTYICALKEMEGIAGAQGEVYTSEFDSKTPIYLIYSRGNSNTFDIELNHPIGQDIGPELPDKWPDECKLGGKISEENVLCKKCNLERTVELLKKIFRETFLAPRHDIRVMTEVPEGGKTGPNTTVGELLNDLEQEKLLNKQERQDFYKECLTKVRKSGLEVVTDFRFKDVELNGEEAWIQFLSQPSEKTFTGTLGYQLSNNSNVKEISSKCKFEEQGPEGTEPNHDYLTNCHNLNVQEAADIAESFFEDFCNIPEKARPILDLYSV